MTQLASAVQALRRVRVFASLDDEEARRLAESMASQHIPAGHIIFSEGAPGDRFYVVLEGEVEAVKALGTTEERRLTAKGPGEYFGEMSLFDPAGLRTAAIRTTQPSHLLSLDRKGFQSLLQRHPAVALELVRVLTLQLRDTNNATIADLRRKNEDLAAAYAELKAAQAQIIEKEKLEQELRTARRIQQSILPASLPALTGYDFGALMQPARTVGGDLYDFVPLPGERLGIAVGDVSGKGVPAAIFMALTRSLLRAEATQPNGSLDCASPRCALERVNRLLLDMNEEGMFVTLLYGILDARARTFTYARAGHELPLLIGPDCAIRLADYGQGVALGLFEAPAIDEQIIPLTPGDTLLLYTDGATDVTDAADEAYGMERLQVAAAAGSRTAAAQAVCEAIWRDIDAHRGATEQADDVTLVAVRTRDA